VEIGRVIGSLAIVLVVIVGLKYLATHVLGMKAAGPGSNRGVRVLSRTVMAPKQQLVLLQVGRKLVLVADCGGRVSTLTEITDPDEVAELAAQASGQALRVERFTSALTRRASEFDEYEEQQSGYELTAEPEPGLAELSDRVRTISRRFAHG
jgi:flagellar biogenesis protein FliO